MKGSKNRTRSPNDSVTTGLKEKYLHSKAAKLLEAGSNNKALDLFKKAIKIKDQSYTRYHCGLAYMKNGQISEAIVELNRAIELNPDIPEYYIERGKVLQMIGDGLNAINDDNRAIQLDNHCAQMGMIKASMKMVKDFFSGPAWLDGLGKKKIKNQKLLETVRDIVEARNMRQEILNSSSCSLPCPSYCCYFSEETIIHGLYIGPWKLHAIREFLREKNLPEDQYISKISYGGEQYLKELIPPQFVVSEKGEKQIYYPLRQEKKLHSNSLKNMPKGNEYQTLVWINKKARACIFLQNGRCMIHDAGGEDSLPSCKEFLCLTGFAFAVLKSLGIIHDEDIVCPEMEGLNRVALASMLVLAKEMFGHKGVIKYRGKMEELLKKAIDADRSGNEIGVTRLLEDYEKEKAKYDGVISDLKRNLRTTVDNLFDGQ